MLIGSGGNNGGAVDAVVGDDEGSAAWRGGKQVSGLAVLAGGVDGERDVGGRVGDLARGEGAEAGDVLLFVGGVALLGDSGDDDEHGDADRDGEAGGESGAEAAAERLGLRTSVGG